MANSDTVPDELMQRCDPEFLEVVTNFPSLQFADPAAQRARFAAMQASAPRVPIPEGITVVTVDLASAVGHPIPVRVYSPRRANVGDVSVLWIHGGGYVTGSVDEDEVLCAHLAARLSIRVISVDYRLAPEHPFPAGFDDCSEVLEAIISPDGPLSSSGDQRVIVAGASAGAGLAAALAVKHRDEGLSRIAGQVLLCPFIDSTMSTASMDRLASSPIFDRQDAQHCWEHYLGDRRLEPPAYASPSSATDLTDLPPAYIAAAGLDCLHDEAVDYGTRLRAAGVPVELHSFDGVPHGFTGVAPRTRASRRALGDVTDAITRFIANDKKGRST